jgi:Arc/MetJ-type ribon-helix-helix transcriptional regulator
MKKKRERLSTITIRLSNDVLDAIEEKIDTGFFRNRSHAVNQYLKYVLDNGIEVGAHEMSELHNGHGREKISQDNSMALPGLRVSENRGA